MTGRERFLTALDHREPDRVPVFANITPDLALLLSQTTGLPCNPIPSFVTGRVSFHEILLPMGNDAVSIGPTSTLQYLDDEKTRYSDEWGFVYEKVGSHTEIISRPLSHADSIEDIKDYRLPDVSESHRWETASGVITRYRQEYAVLGFTGVNPFEMAWNLTGFEKFLMDLQTSENYALSLLDRLYEFAGESGRILVEMGVDAVWIGDDIGTQTGMLFSPDIWKKTLKPRMKELIADWKTRNRELKIVYHSCGSIVPVIPDLIEIGVDVLNPIQPRATGMDLRKLKKQFGERLSFMGGVDIQEVLPMGTPDDVEAHVKDRIEAAADHGGYIVAPAHIIQLDTPPENVKVFYEAVRKYGKYG